MTDSIIPFDAEARLLGKVRGYLCNMEELIQDGDQAVGLLINALHLADSDLKLRIVLMLGAMADPRVIDPLYQLMADDKQYDSLRHAAAVQLSLVGARIADNGWVDRLVGDLGDAEPFMRASAAFALGWEGNRRAVAALVNALGDPDMEVQQAAVSALTNIKDERLFAVLTERLVSGPKEQQRCILYHLCCFASRRREVAQICTRFLSHPDADLRYDALVVLDAVSGVAKPLPLFLQCLEDPDPRIREVALAYLDGEDKRRLKALAPKVRPLARDPVPNIRQAAVRLLHHICDGPVAMPER
jgi:HEAT repeat protein